MMSRRPIISNYDWGQGLPDLRKWQQQHPGADRNVWYFGSDPSAGVAPVPTKQVSYGGTLK